jgi:hypothetical protein
VVPPVLAAAPPAPEALPSELLLDDDEQAEMATTQNANKARARFDMIFLRGER